MKILILTNNLPFSIEDDAKHTVVCFNKYLPLEFTFKAINVPITLEQYKTVQGFDKNTGKPATVKYLGVTQAVRDAIKPYAGSYECVVFAWDIDTAKLKADEVVTSFAEQNPLAGETHFIQLAVNQYVKDKGDIYARLSHEILHMLCYKANRKGIVVLDEMDNTVVDGKIIPFYKNDDPYAVDGNFAHTLKNLQPYFDYLKNPVVKPVPVTPVTASVTLKLGMFGATQLQTDLRTLGYFNFFATGYFGPLTQSAVKAFQKANGLVEDGVVGKLTAEAIKKKV